MFLRNYQNIIKRLIHYFAKNLEAFEAIQYLLIIYGILAIQSGGEEKYVRDRLPALLPCDAENLYIKERQELLSTPEAQEKEMNDRLSQCSMNIYTLIVKLIDSGEISCEDGGRLCTFYKFFTDGGEQWLKD